MDVQSFAPGPEIPIMKNKPRFTCNCPQQPLHTALAVHWFPATLLLIGGKPLRSSFLNSQVSVVWILHCATIAREQADPFSNLPPDPGKILFPGYGRIEMPDSSLWQLLSPGARREDLAPSLQFLGIKNSEPSLECFELVFLSGELSDKEMVSRIAWFSGPRGSVTLIVCFLELYATFVAFGISALVFIGGGIAAISSPKNSKWLVQENRLQVYASSILTLTLLDAELSSTIHIF
ncbi:hypothetical protein SDJN03_30204, partial [Cucurbita argyrosperma subsp. sororia]